MCGITGIFGSRDFLCHFDQDLTKMADAIWNRGPDDSGFWIDREAGVGLAHRRLSIIDLSPTGKQPMASHSGRYIISYNGEIYNYIELKRELSDFKVNWQGTSDTEIMLASIEAWGIETAVEKFNGMFAFALWDRKKRRLTLCRDRVGIKPLYYGRIGKSIVFGSELKCLTQFPGVRKTIDEKALWQYLKFNYIPAPLSIYADIFKLKPGHFIQFTEADLAGETPMRSQCYWDCMQRFAVNCSQPFEGSDEEAVKALDALLKDAVGKQMMSDVPLGAFLSGGIDSSTVVAMMQSMSQGKINTFSIGFDEAGYDESVFAERVAEHLGTVHTQLTVDGKTARDVIPGLPRLYDEPFSDSSQIPTYLVSKLARNKVTVSLSGDGGDELFGGYNRHALIPYIWGKIGQVNPGLRALGVKLMTAIPPKKINDFFNTVNQVLPEGKRLNRAGDKLDKLAGIIALNSPEAIYDTLCSNFTDPDPYLVPRLRQSVGHRPPGFDGRMDLSQQIMLRDLITYLPNDILTKLDRASMGVSLEGRVPLLDHRVIEFSWQLPLSMKIRNKKGKWILRQVLKKYVPEHLFDRPKTGFGVPIDTWFRGELRSWGEDLLSVRSLTRQGIFDVQRVRRLWEDHVSGRHNWQYQLWNILSFQAWYHETIV